MHNNKTASTLSSTYVHDQYGARKKFRAVEGKLLRGTVTRRAGDPGNRHMVGDGQHSHQLSQATGTSN